MLRMVPGQPSLSVCGISIICTYHRLSSGIFSLQKLINLSLFLRVCRVALEDVADVKPCMDPSLPAGHAFWVSLHSLPTGLYFVAGTPTSVLYISTACTVVVLWSAIFAMSSQRFGLPACICCSVCLYISRRVSLVIVPERPASSDPGSCFLGCYKPGDSDFLCVLPYMGCVVVQTIWRLRKAGWMQS